MIGDQVHGKLVANRLLTDVEDIMLEAYNLPEGYVDIGLFETEFEGIGYVAADDATKKANVEVVSIHSTHGGSGLGKSNDGHVFGIISGPMVSDVERGLRYVRNYIENEAGVYSISEDDSVLIYAEYVSRIGKYFAKALDLKEGSSIAYLVAPSMYGVIGVDEALTLANVEVVKYWGDPTASNLCGAIVTGTQSQCQMAVEGFKNAIFDCAEEPIEY